MLKLGEVCQLPSEGKAKAYSTWYSQAVSHPSTNQARPCLASEIRRDLACPGWYGRKRSTMLKSRLFKEDTPGGVFLKDLKTRVPCLCLIGIKLSQKK